MFYRVFAVLLAFSLSCANALKIEINKGDVKPDPIAIVSFYDENGNDSEDGNEICKIIKTDLELCGLFIPLNENSFLESKKDLCTKGPNIKNWNILNTRFLVHGKIIQTSSGKFSIDFVLVDVVTGHKMLALKVDGTVAKLRKIAHVIADFIYERITNEQGYFNTNVVYVETVSSKDSSKRKTRIIKVDQDGFNARQLTDGSELVLTPRYSSDGRMIAFISYKDKATGALGKSAHVYIMDSDSGRKKLMINESLMKELVKRNKGNPIQMTYAPRFSPDSNSAVLAIIIEGESFIYSINFATNELKQLTHHNGVDWSSKDGSKIDTSPCYSHDGKKIVFTSNRKGREALYMMNPDGSNIQRISNGEGKYSQPMWSPRGDLIAFAKQVGREFYIGIIKPDGSGERLIARGELVEAPCWSSNGRYIVYSMSITLGGKYMISVVDLTGNHTRIIETRGDASYPTWSPTLAVQKNKHIEPVTNSAQEIQPVSDSETKAKAEPDEKSVKQNKQNKKEESIETQESSEKKTTNKKVNEVKSQKNDHKTKKEEPKSSNKKLKENGVNHKKELSEKSNKVAKKNSGNNKKKEGVLAIP